MTRDVMTVSPSTPLKDVAQLLVDRRISGVPVVDLAGVVVGVVSETDLLIKEAGENGLAPRRLSWLLGEGPHAAAQRAKITAVTAGEAMTWPAVTAGPGLPLASAAELMVRHGLNRLPVVQDGRLVGIVTRTNLVRSFVRPDEEIAACIRDEVLRRILWLDPTTFDVDVRDGVVSIHGRVERRSTAQSIEATIGMVPGVVAVEAELSWSLDDRQLEPASVDPVFPFGPQ
ncbi:MAG TPA: CBS domain-containing protein [Candidatus Limnocylindrales bacterium]|nr:CBS domain-containing protein [Candidatus Limnocylindrales bacterium]